MSDSPSVYRHFQDVEAFHEEIQRLRSQRTASELVRDGKRGQKRDPVKELNRDQLPQKRDPVKELNRDQLPLLPADTPAAGTGRK